MGEWVWCFLGSILVFIRVCVCWDVYCIVVKWKKLGLEYLDVVDVFLKFFLKGIKRNKLKLFFLVGNGGVGAGRRVGLF